MRKQLELILTASLPVVILIVGFIAVTSRASIWDHETAEPEGAAPYYRDARNHPTHPTPDPENTDGIYFGVEIYSTNLCESADNDFDIESTYEVATTPRQSAPDRIYWYRNQSWVFSDSETPWGTAYANFTSSKDYVFSTLPDGFPWSGTESHWRGNDDQGMYIQVSARVKRWKTTTFDNQHYLCPYEYKFSNTYKYYCDSGDKDWGDHIEVKDSESGNDRDHHFSEPRMREDMPGVLTREVVQTGVLHDCIQINL